MEPGPGKHRKRTSQELAYDALIQFASTARLFYVQIAKAIHNPSRRREEAPGTPSMPMQAAAAVVSITMRDALTSAREMVGGLSHACALYGGLAWQCILSCMLLCVSIWAQQERRWHDICQQLEMPNTFHFLHWSSWMTVKRGVRITSPKHVHRLLLQWPGLYQALPEECVQRPLPTAQLANYITHMAGGLGNTLFDSRRRTCHSLVLNYFVAGNGLPILLEHFTLAVGLLRVTAAIQVPPHPDGKPGAHLPLHQRHSPGHLGQHPFFAGETGAERPVPYRPPRTLRARVRG